MWMSGYLTGNPVEQYHIHAMKPNQCCSTATRAIAAPVGVVWSVLRRFDNSQGYKHFIRSCRVVDGDGRVGTVREVRHPRRGEPRAARDSRRGAPRHQLQHRWRRPPDRQLPLRHEPPPVTGGGRRCRRGVLRDRRPCRKHREGAQPAVPVSDLGENEVDELIKYIPVRPKPAKGPQCQPTATWASSAPSRGRCSNQHALLGARSVVVTAIAGFDFCPPVQAAAIPLICSFQNVSVPCPSLPLSLRFSADPPRM
ncbi:hypothetical protein SAY86_005341 [Trapa natans]|uniref:Uncharacterized protein n=1 Tax=Trapa natans TaxID=22666 RepID=A0AAN7KUM2_TRANT|nr:hypothetical protein SAY86_005341 [Trapa natans]